MPTQDIRWHPKPEERTTKPVKKALALAFLLYGLAVIVLLSGSLGAALFLAMIGLISHKVVAPLLNWWTTG